MMINLGKSIKINAKDFEINNSDYLRYDYCLIDNIDNIVTKPLLHSIWWPIVEPIIISVDDWYAIRD